MKINEVARLTGITVRTLHYYDEIGLLKPTEITVSGYRLYDDNALAKLQQILFFRELDFPLNEIKKIISSPVFDKTRALENHRKLLIKKNERLENLISLVDNIIKGENAMSFKEFDLTEIEKTKKEFITEVNERWGNSDAFVESEKKAENYGKEQWQQISDDGGCILKAFAQNINKSADSAEVQALVVKWQDFITAKFYKCTKEILAGLGQMYVGDVRFTENIDKYGVGTAKFMAEAIAVYCKTEPSQVL